MTSEIEALKTNEFIRRRKLRLQQVREQSKDIAKKIRQRAKVEKLRQVVDLDVKKQKEYLQQQGELVKKLEDLYSKGVENVGASHRSASELREQGDVQKVDVSKLRGREAAAELRRKKQEKLDQQKKILDRKLQAREAANELSREKSSAIVNKLINKTGDNQDKAIIVEEFKDSEKLEENAVDKEKPLTTDMATQWDLNEPEWEPNVPQLALPKDDSAKDNIESKSDKSKRLDLFALSKEMPSSLRGGVTSEERVPIKSSLTVVSEYLQNRALRLRETSTSAPKKPSEDLLSIKETILRTRTSRAEVKSNTEKSLKSSAIDSGTAKKNSVTMYNHSTRDSRDIRGDERFVVRDEPNNDDAYAQARRETILDNSKQQDPQKKIQEMRHKVAMTKQNVEKEYKDTITFLNSLPKDKGRPIRKAYMDEQRQQMQKDNHEQQLQQEYKKIEKQCRKHNHTQSRSKSKSPVTIVDDDLDNRDFQYSWMPVPEGDGNLAIHTIPTTVKEGKSGKVKFNKVDSYHEYRSRHRHTPPTKDNSDKQTKRVETVIIEKNSSDITDYSSNVSESSSVENIRFNSKTSTVGTEKELSDAERIIIYKILDSKSANKSKKKEKFMQSILKSLNSIDKNKRRNVDATVEQHKEPVKNTENKNATFEQLNEGVYKAVNEKGDNITSMSTHFMNNPVLESRFDANELNRKTCCCSASQQCNENIISHSKNKDTSRCHCTGPPKTVDKNPTVTQQPAASMTTSISSFKTANNDKMSSALPDGDYVKLLDDSGQEAGKFYIGASGLLKDDAYEVVIQLRKRDGVGDRNEAKTTIIQTSSNEIPPSSVQVTQVTVEEAISNVSEGKRQIANEINATIQEPTTEITIDNEPMSINPEKCEDVNTPIEISQRKMLVDKGVHTSFQMSYAIPSHLPKVDPISRPATSTYTQTTLSSPNHRPVFFHMSSSTSTAYMSPPELVLPEFLKQDYRMTDEEKYDTMHFLNRRGYMSEQEYSEQNNECRCKKCSHVKRNTVNKIKSHDCCKKHSKYGNKLDTPPNTARSQSSGDLVSHKAEKTKHWGSKTSRKSHNHKQQTKIMHKLSQQNNVHPSSSAAVSNKKMKMYPEVRKNIPHSDLNPVLQKYVNKLLALNKESLKAVEVADQDCSAVTTPGSSIINVTKNINKNKPIENKISFEQLKIMLKQQIVNENNDVKHDHIQDRSHSTKKNHTRRNKRLPRTNRKKPVHKIKSLNISRNLQRSYIPLKCFSGNIASSLTSSKGSELPTHSVYSKTNGRSTTSATPKHQNNKGPIKSSTTSDMATGIYFSTSENYAKRNHDCDQYSERKISSRREIKQMPCYPTSLATSSSDTDNNFMSQNSHNLEIPTTMSTQSNQNMNSDINLIKLAEDKLQNMEKIADLTEKCTKRLSNLAKVLEEVRRNKSLVYSQISTSDSTSDSDQKSDKTMPRNLPPIQIVAANIDVAKTSSTPSPLTTNTIEEYREKNIPSDSTDFAPFLNDIPKPSAFKPAEPTNMQNPVYSKKINSQSTVKNLQNTTPPVNRGRPPPALSRITLKNGHDNITPHELSTVLEVDSLLSVRLTRDNRGDLSDESTKTMNGTAKQESSKSHSPEVKDSKKGPDLLGNSVDIPINQIESSDDSKLQVIDINQFNDIMLKPFITFQEHAKKCNIAFDTEASNLEDIVNDVVTEDISSLHSDGSLPDVIAELLKRNIIREPFKFDSPSNVNSTTISSESSLSLLALSKVRKDKKKSSVCFQNKENIGETSDSLSLSSNPDLEIAFKKLGMGWASSTLKKTKERLALSSSTNTSSSSLSQFKLKSFTNQDIPVLVTDSVSSILNVTKKPENKKVNFISKNAEQQTSLANSMTVKEFLTNELAKKITFTNKSHKDESGEEFVSLLETKMPQDMKDSGHTVHEEHSADSVRSGNRARTSTPVQIFKSMTYHSSSSSNISNGLFSNADDISSVKVTSNSNKNHSTSDKDDLTIPNFSLKMKKSLSDCSKSE